jgi:hypothetical protein
LRQRLREYFETEGADEPVVLTVPKGSYVPRFEARVRKSEAVIGPAGHAEDGSDPPEILAENAVSAGEITSESVVAAKASDDARRWKFAFAVACCVALIMGLALFAHLRGPRHHREHIFWTSFLDPRNGRTTLVEADSGLVLLQHFTRRPVSLASYVSGDYLRDTSSAGEKPETVARVGSRRYAPAVDSVIYERLSHLLPDSQENISVRYARDVQLDELKQGNAILLGTHESNPWVELFENSMNFVFRNDLAAGTTAMVNRHPKAGEPGMYPMLNNDPQHIVYGLVAYRPNLTHTGHVLIIEGETMAGTQTASDFVLDDAQFLPFLKKIQQKDGSIPHFEVLLRSSSLGGESAQVNMVAYRTEPN